MSDPTSAEPDPLNEFSGCHEGIIRNFHHLSEFADRVEQGEDPETLRPLAKRLLRFFEDVVLEHHGEEEEELFTAVRDSLDGEADAELAQQQIDRLVREHRDLEALWSEIEPAIRRIARGKPAALDSQRARLLAERYLAHAAFEEREFLPLAKRILSKNAMSALGLSLHMRHQRKVNPYI